MNFASNPNPLPHFEEVYRIECEKYEAALEFYLIRHLTPPGESLEIESGSLADTLYEYVNMPTPLSMASHPLSQLITGFKSDDSTIDGFVDKNEVLIRSLTQTWQRFAAVRSEYEVTLPISATLFSKRKPNKYTIEYLTAILSLFSFVEEEDENQQLVR